MTRLPLPLRERAGVRGNLVELSRVGRRNKPDSLHRVSPHPLPQGERGPETEPPVQNEPTAQTTAASPAPADGCSAPDPQEMAALRKFTDQLSRCRPRDDAQESDDDYKDDLMT
jgi:septal ring-binding cell division protein DamX